MEQNPNHFSEQDPVTGTDKDGHTQPLHTHEQTLAQESNCLRNRGYHLAVGKGCLFVGVKAGLASCNSHAFILLLYNLFPLSLSFLPLSCRYSSKIWKISQKASTEMNSLNKKQRWNNCHPCRSLYSRSLCVVTRELFVPYVEHEHLLI